MYHIRLLTDLIERKYCQVGPPTQRNDTESTIKAPYDAIIRPYKDL